MIFNLSLDICGMTLLVLLPLSDFAHFGVPSSSARSNGGCKAFAFIAISGFDFA